MKPSGMTAPTGFLSHLVARARGTDSAIEPRLPSLFEPVAVPSTALAAEPAELSVPPSPRPDTAPDGVPGAKQPPAVGGLRPLELPPLTGSARREEAPLEEGRQAHEPPARPVPRAVARAAASMGFPAEEPGSRPATAGSRPDAAPRERPRPRGSSAPSAAPLETERAKAGAVTGEQRSVLQEPERRAPGALVAQPVAVLVPRIGIQAPQASHRDLPPADDMREQPAPVINVTIGRVEVRAVPGAPAKPRIEQAKPRALSLDDYLKQRGGRR